MSQVKDWSEVMPGDIVLGRDRRAWTMMAREGSTVTIETDGKAPYTGQPTGPVTVLSSAAEEMELATALVQVRLGGVVEAEQDEQGRWLVPVTFTHFGSLAAHIYLLHGQRIDLPEPEQSLRTLLATHDQLHTPERKTDGSGYVDHVHEPDFYARRNKE